MVFKYFPGVLNLLKKRYVRTGISIKFQIKYAHAE